MENIKQAIKSAREGDVAGFRDQINVALAQKVSDRLDVEKISTANRFFNNTGGSDEEV